MNKIDNFRDENYFLSNFYPCAFYFEDICYMNSEAAFQAQKLENKIDREQFKNLSPNMAKKIGRTVTLRKNWDNIKLDIMYDIVKSKFAQNKNLAIKLKNTGDAELIEGNTWNDTYWGVCNGVGQNKLGKILMRVREELE